MGLSTLDPKSWVEINFERLKQTQRYELVSDWDEDYNCIAFAAGDTEHWWWPPVPFDGGDYWPPDAPPDLTVAAFEAAFRTVGYEPCDSADLEDGQEKVALFLSANGLPTHAARQIADGRWVSKLGSGFDIIHDELDGVGGFTYGEPALIFRRSAS